MSWRTPTIDDVGQEMLVHHHSFVDPDFIPDGVAAGTLTYRDRDSDDVDAICAVWCGYHDEYHTKILSTDDFLVHEMPESPVDESS